jgi:hypothetical protein
VNQLHQAKELACVDLMQYAIACNNNKRPLSRVTEVGRDRTRHVYVKEPLTLAHPSLPSLPPVLSTELRLKTKVLLPSLRRFTLLFLNTMR